MADATPDGPPLGCGLDFARVGEGMRGKKEQETPARDQKQTNLRENNRIPRQQDKDNRPYRQHMNKHSKSQHRYIHGQE